MGDDGWVEWEGGECPVAMGTLMVVRFRDGEISELSTAKMWNWDHRFGRSDIIAYRIVQP